MILYVTTTGYWNINKYASTRDIHRECCVRHSGIQPIHEQRIENTERDVGFLLSGGLDSSLIASIASRKIMGKIKTFSIGLPWTVLTSAAARKVAEYHWIPTTQK
jgi:asparagine synthase (glutamine-hydrolysing)